MHGEGFRCFKSDRRASDLLQNFDTASARCFPSLQHIACTPEGARTEKIFPIYPSIWDWAAEPPNRQDAVKSELSERLPCRRRSSLLLQPGLARHPQPHSPRCQHSSQELAQRHSGRLHPSRQHLQCAGQKRHTPAGCEMADGKTSAGEASSTIEGSHSRLANVDLHMMRRLAMHTRQS